MKRLKTALLGLRGVGADYLDALCSDDQFELLAVGDTDARAQSDRLAEMSVRHYTDYRSLVVETAAVGLDLLVVATEPHESVGFVTLAASRGVHVFHKAPLARGVEEAREIVRLFAEHNAKIVVARPWEFDPAFASLATLDQLVGQVYAATAFVTTCNHALPVGRDRFAGGREIETAAGGALLHDAYEVIDMLVHLLGLPESVYAQRAATHESREAIFMTLRFADERVGSVAVLRGSLARQADYTGASWTVTLAGTTATATMSPGAMRISSGEAGGSPEQAEPTRNQVVPVGRALSAFGGALLSGVADVKGAAETHLGTVATIEAANLSTRTGAPEAPRGLLG